MMILGIDPGLHGAFAFYELSTNLVVSAANIPTFEITRNKKVKNVVDTNALVCLARDSARTYPGLRACIELVGAMPGQGVSSVFAFGRVDGMIEAAVVAAGIPFDKVTPQTWKKALACPADKDGALLRAGQLMPASVQHWTPVRGERDKEACKGIAEAALIAYWRARKI